MGFGGQEFGLAVFPTVKDLRLQYSNLEPDQLMQKMTAFSVTYGESELLPFDDLDAITKHGWPVAGPDSYPLVMKNIPPGKLVLPSKAEIALLAAVLRTLPDFRCTASTQREARPSAPLKRRLPSPTFMPTSKSRTATLWTFRSWQPCANRRRRATSR